jgi:hypothetical protein
MCTACPRRAKEIATAVRLLEDDAVGHPGLASHRYETLDDFFGERVWESYVENKTPSAWRMWWFFGPERNQITVLDIGPHP